jgi:hypothetical protein
MVNANPVTDLFTRAVKHGVRMAAICDRAQVARSTPSRWKGSRNGANLETVNRLNAALNAIIAERALPEVHDGSDTIAPQQSSCGNADEISAQVPA